MRKARKPSSEKQPPQNIFDSIEELNRKRLGLVFSAFDQTRRKLLSDAAKVLDAANSGSPSIAKGLGRPRDKDKDKILDRAEPIARENPKISAKDLRDRLGVNAQQLTDQDISKLKGRIKELQK